MWTLEPTPAALTCPFCGLGCDDLHAAPDADGRLALVNGCALAQAAFASAMAAGAPPPCIAGRPADLDDALAAAARLLAAARAPLFAGLAADVNGMRALIALAGRCGAILDHAAGDALFRNLLVLQDGGWVTTTLTEVRNRADLILMLGAQAPSLFPRIIERVLYPPAALFSPPASRRLVLLGPWDPAGLPPALAAVAPTVIPVALDDLAGVAGLLRGRLAGRPVRPDAIPGIDGGRLADLALALSAARYAVVTWAADELAFAHAELTVQAWVELIRDLNRHTRAAALPLAGTLGDLTAAQVSTWQTGYPTRCGLRPDGPVYEPRLYRHQDLLAQDQCDLLLWVQALPAATAPAAPPLTARPTIVLGHPGLTVPRAPEIAIPVGIPGLDHPGHWYRSDAVCPLPLGQVRAVGLPSVAAVIRALAARLGDRDPSPRPPC